MTSLKSFKNVLWSYFWLFVHTVVQQPCTLKYSMLNFVKIVSWKIPIAYWKRRQFSLTPPLQRKLLIQSLVETYLGHFCGSMFRIVWRWRIRKEVTSWAIRLVGWALVSGWKTFCERLWPLLRLQFSRCWLELGAETDVWSSLVC